MRIFRNLQFIALFSIFAFFALSFSCCGIPVEHGSSGHGSHDFGNVCCSIFSADHFVIAHNQPASSADAISIAVAMSIAAFAVFFAFSFAKEVRRLILYERIVRFSFGSAKQFNPFTAILSQGILNPKIF